ncbi:MAG: flagellar basal body rod protein FlgB [Candidatus Omnitrophota bacterium]|jgi:flagellar basal-body rod protein FlgB|nr:MAG: flagellar basal body rod protein FlgB [Candidatus Omnitrophota bacterium]
MLIGHLFDNTTLNVLKKGIDGTLARNHAIANNIANVDTPKYQRATVSFEDQIKRVLRGEGVIGRRTHSAHFIIGGPQEIPLIRPRTDIDNKTRFRADKNNINIDQEMADLAQNTLRNTEFTDLLNRRYQAMRNAIQQSGQ